MDAPGENTNNSQEAAAIAGEDGPDANTTTKESSSHPEDTTANTPEVCAPNASPPTIRIGESVLVWLDENINLHEVLYLSDPTNLLGLCWPEDTTQNTQDGRAPNTNSSDINITDSEPIWLNPGQNVQAPLDVLNPEYFVGLVSPEAREQAPINISNGRDVDVVLVERQEDKIVFRLLDSSDPNSSTYNARYLFNHTSEDRDENSVDKWETASENNDTNSESSSDLSSDDQWETASDSSAISSDSDMNSLRPLFYDSTDDYSDTEAESECSESSEYSGDLIEDSVEPDDEVLNVRSF